VLSIIFMQPQGVAANEFAGRAHRKPVDILARVDGLDDPVRVDLPGHGHLHQDAVDGGVGVERRDALEQSRLAERGVVLLHHRVQAAFGACLDLVAHVDGAGRVVADQDDRQTRPAAAPGQHLGAGGHLGPDSLRQHLAVDELCGHVRFQMHEAA
jgi:hypothetical protein